MPYVIAAVVVLAVLAAVNLVLTLGIVKRLREHTQMIVGMNDAGRTCKGLGEEIGAFSATTTDGQTLTHRAFEAKTLVGFFSPTCPPCREKLPRFVAHARTFPGGRDRVLAAVVGDLDGNADMIRALTPVARVVVEKNNEEPLGAAFRVMGFPSVVTVGPDQDGRAVVTQEQVELRPVTVA